MWARILLLLFVFSFLFRTDLSFDQDLGRHIKLGEIIINTHQIPKTNLFSYTNPNFPFINTHWMFEVLAFLFFATGHLQMLLILKVVIILLSVWLTLRIIPKTNSALLLPVGFILLHVLRERLELRPEIFSFLFTAVTYYLLEKYLKKPTRLIYLFPLVQLLWINTHIYFFVGLVIQAIFLIHLGIQYLRSRIWDGRLKVLSIIFVLSILVSLINPNALTGLLYPLNVNQNYGYTIVENQTIFLLESLNFIDPNFIFVKFAWGIVLLSLVVALIRKKLELKNLLLVTFGLGLSILNVRSFPYLIFLSLPATFENFGPTKFSGATKLLMFIASVFLIWESFSYVSGNYYNSKGDSHRVGLKMVENVKGAMDFVIANDLPSPIFNNFDIGSYIIYKGFPEYRVFVDGRPEAYPKEFFLNTYIPMQSDFSRFQLEERKFKFKTIIFSHTDQTPWGQAFLQAIIKDPDWKTVYLDNFMIVLVQKGVASQRKLNIINL